MKGVIVLCLKEMVLENFGEGKWKESLKKAGIENEPLILPIADVEDDIVLKVVGSLCDVLKITLTQAADAFGDYWVNVYSQKMYRPYYERAKNSKEFLLNVDAVHVASTKNLPDAHPPRFEYEWKDDKTLIMKYISPRNLIDFMVGLIKGVGKFYKEDLKVTRLDDNKAEIVFP